MKNLFITLLFALLINVSVSAQQVCNFDTPKTEKQLIGKSTRIMSSTILKGISYPVYKSVKGKLFIVYLNKKGNYSKKYIGNASI